MLIFQRRKNRVSKKRSQNQWRKINQWTSKKVMNLTETLQKRKSIMTNQKIAARKKRKIKLKSNGLKKILTQFFFWQDFWSKSTTIKKRLRTKGNSLIWRNISERIMCIWLIQERFGSDRKPTLDCLRNYFQINQMGDGKEKNLSLNEEAASAVQGFSTSFKDWQFSPTDCEVKL